MMRKIFTPILLVLLSTLSILLCAQEAAHSGQSVNSGAGSWFKDPITNCAVWGSALHGNNLVSWSGDCRDGKANGTGVLNWINDGKLAGRYSGPMWKVKRKGSAPSTSG